MFFDDEQFNKFKDERTIKDGQDQLMNVKCAKNMLYKDYTKDQVVGFFKELKSCLTL